MKKQTIDVQGLIIRIEEIKDSDYVSLTDIAKQRNKTEPRFLIRSWLKNNSTLEFLNEWENLHNDNFKRDQMNTFRLESQSNSHVPNIKSFIEKTGSIGITSKSGRYGGTYAHSDIALNFMYWISPKFQVYFIKEFQALKKSEALRLGKSWDLKREISKANYSLLTEAIKENNIPALPPKTKGIQYASEADLINIAVFGMTASQWKKANPKTKGNIRDNASVSDLLILANMEALAAVLINVRVPRKERENIVIDAAANNRDILTKNKAVERIKKTT